MLWVLKRTVSMRWFFSAPKTNVKTDGLENNRNFKLKHLLIQTYNGTSWLYCTCIFCCCWKYHWSKKGLKMIREWQCTRCLFVNTGFTIYVILLFLLRILSLNWLITTITLWKPILQTLWTQSLGLDKQSDQNSLCLFPWSEVVWSAFEYIVYAADVKSIQHFQDKFFKAG